MFRNKSSRDPATNLMLAKRWTPILQTVLLHVLLMVFLYLSTTDENLITLAELLKALMIIGIIACIFFLSFVKNPAQERRTALIYYAITLVLLLGLSVLIHLFFWRNTPYGGILTKVFALYQFAVPMAGVLSGLWFGQRYFRRKAGSPSKNKK